MYHERISIEFHETLKCLVMAHLAKALHQFSNVFTVGNVGRPTMQIRHETRDW